MYSYIDENTQEDVAGDGLSERSLRRGGGRRSSSRSSFSRSSYGKKSYYSKTKIKINSYNSGYGYSYGYGYAGYYYYNYHYGHYGTYNSNSEGGSFAGLIICCLCCICMIVIIVCVIKGNGRKSEDTHEEVVVEEHIVEHYSEGSSSESDFERLEPGVVRNPPPQMGVAPGQEFQQPNVMSAPQPYDMHQQAPMGQHFQM